MPARPAIIQHEAARVEFVMHLRGGEGEKAADDRRIERRRDVARRRACPERSACVRQGLLGGMQPRGNGEEREREDEADGDHEFRRGMFACGYFFIPSSTACALNSVVYRLRGTVFMDL